MGGDCSLKADATAPQTCASYMDTDGKTKVLTCCATPLTWDVTKAINEDTKVALTAEL